MQLIQLLFFAFGAAALGRAWLATRRTALFHAVHWGIAAWAAWAFVTFLQFAVGPTPWDVQQINAGIFIALCLTACTGVAVLGARRPHVAAWDFVVLGLLAVMTLPLIESALIGARSLDWLRLTFLAVTLGVGVLNHVPTRFGLPAFLLGLGCAGEFVGLLAPTSLAHGPEAAALRLCILAAPALAWVAQKSGGPRQDPDRMWLNFRDRWGVVWGQRVREQFNRAAANSGWPVTLTWFGFTYQQSIDATTRENARSALAALLKRFDKEEAAGP